MDYGEVRNDVCMTRRTVNVFTDRLEVLNKRLCKNSQEIRPYLHRNRYGNLSIPRFLEIFPEKVEIVRN